MEPDQGNTLGGEESRKAGPPPGACPRSGTAPPKATRWPKGRSGNPRGRPKGRGLTDSVIRVLAQEHNGRPLVEVLAEVMVKHALAGKFPFAKELWDRTEGRVQDRVQVRSEATHRVVLNIPSPRVLDGPDAEEPAPRRRPAGDPDGCGQGPPGLPPPRAG